MRADDDERARSRLFVYGSLLDARLRRRLLKRDVVTVPAILREYERRQATYFFIVKRPGSVVAGEELRDLTDHDLAALDLYEEVPQLYTRQLIEVEIAGGAREHCWVYLPRRC